MRYEHLLCDKRPLTHVLAQVTLYGCSSMFLQMVSRSGKLTYRWEGIAHLPRLLAMLYSDAIAGKLSIGPTQCQQQ